MSDHSNCQQCRDLSCSARARARDETDEAFSNRQALHRRMCRIRHKIVVLSDKGGVGKSTVAAVFGSGGGERMAREQDVPFLGCLPVDPQLMAACDAGIPFWSRFAETPTAGALRRIVQPILLLRRTQA